MNLSVKSLALTLGVLWAGCILISGLAGIFSPGYAGEFLRIVSSLYPGFHNSGSFGDISVGTLYGFLDGAIGGAVFAWLYNFFSKLKCC